MMHLFNVPKPKSFYNHYSNPQSQGALLCETMDFPKSFNDETQEVFDAYTDRMQEWDYKNYQKAIKIFNGNSMQNANDDQLKDYAHIALKTPVRPDHVRIVHYFNVSNGYSCPLVIAIFPKQSN